MKWTEFIVILGHFLPFYPSNNLENQNVEKMNKAPGAAIILQMWTKIHDHMIYASFILDNFWPFTPLTTKKIKIKKKNKKNTQRYSHFTYVYQKWRSYDVWFLRYGAQ